MADRGNQSVPLTATLTQFDDVLIKKGIVTREQALLAKGFSEDQVLTILVDEAVSKKVAEAQEAVEEIQQNTHAGEHATLEELDELEEDDDFADDGLIQKYRELRLAELKERRAAARFGSLFEIDKADWTREVNDVSQGCWVVVHMYQDSVEACVAVGRALEALAARYPTVKFVRIKATSAVENWPDHRVPALFLYRHGENQQSLIGAPAFGGPHCTAADVECLLAKHQAIDADDPSLLEQDADDSAPPQSSADSEKTRGAPPRRGFFEADDANWDH